MIKNLLKSVINRLGYTLTKKNYSQPKRITFDFILYKYQELIKETSEIYKETHLPELPLNDNRIKLMTELSGTQISEALYIVNYLHKSLHLDGDICEFGIAQGSTSALLAHEIKNLKKNLWLFDSFEGLPKPTEKDLLKDDIFNLGSMEAYTGTMSYKVDIVKERLSEIEFPLNRTKIVNGFIEETIKYTKLPEKVCFAYVDFDFYEPILIALQYLDKTLCKEGYILVDDYDYFSTGAKTAVDEFLQNNPRFEISFPNKAAGHFCMLKKLN